MAVLGAFCCPTTPSPTGAVLRIRSWCVLGVLMIRGYSMTVKGHAKSEKGA